MIDLILDTTNGVTRIYMMEHMPIDSDIGSLFAETEAIWGLHDLGIDATFRSECIIDFFGSILTAIDIDAHFDVVFHTEEMRV